MGCNHKHTKDFSLRSFQIRHIYCADCGCHWFRNRFYNKEQWAEYVEF